MLSPLTQPLHTRHFSSLALFTLLLLQLTVIFPSSYPPPLSETNLQTNSYGHTSFTRIYLEFLHHGLPRF